MLLIIGWIPFETTTGRIKRVITEALRAEICSVVLRLRTRGLVWKSKLIRVVRERGIVGGRRRWSRWVRRRCRRWIWGGHWFLGHINEALWIEKYHLELICVIYYTELPKLIFFGSSFREHDLLKPFSLFSVSNFIAPDWTSFLAASFASNCLLAKSAAAAAADEDDDVVLLDIVGLGFAMKNDIFKWDNRIRIINFGMK